MNGRTYTPARSASRRAWDLVVEVTLEQHSFLPPAAAQLAQRAVSGNAAAMHKLAARFAGGVAGLKKSPGLAAYWYQKAAEQGHAPSQYKLGRCLESGVGRRKDVAAAVGWYEKAAAQGHAPAQCALGSLYNDEEWGNVGHPEAVRWWRRAAAQRHVPALFQLGWAYEQGHGVKQSLVLASRWYQAAAQRGSVRASGALGRTRGRMIGRSIRLSNEGITVSELADIFPDEGTARQWLEALLWPTGEPPCPRCGSTSVYALPRGPMPHRCRDCGKYSSIRTGTAMEHSPLPLKTWVWAIHLELSRVKGISGPKLSRALGVRQATAWSMLKRIRAGVGPFRSAVDRRKCRTPA